MARRTVLLVALVAALVATLAPGTAAPVAKPARAPEGSMVGSPVPQDPGPAVGMVTNRAAAWTPKPAGTVETIVLQYGPYVVHPGSDLPRADIEVAVGANGYVIAAEPVVRRADNSVPSLLDIHIHHAHWMWPDASSPSGYRWFYGTGEEQTQGSIDLRAQADSRYGDGLRYGIRLQQGETLAFLSMLHNKSSETQVVWLEARLGFVHGTRDEILAAKGWDFHHLTPTLHGATFNVPRTGGIYAWPRDASAAELAGYGSSVKRGIGHTWTSPFDGIIVVGAGHMHPGGDNVVVSNLGSQASPCGGSWLSDPDGDGFKGVALVRSRHITRDGVKPSEDFQMGITNPGWRARVRAGDVIAINGVYDATVNAYPDAMSFFGFYTDTRPEERNLVAPCTATVIGDPSGDPTFTDINRPWDTREALRLCAATPAERQATGRPLCDANAAAPQPGESVSVITIAGFGYLPSGGAIGAPAVPRGERVTFVNADAAAGIRHTVTTCPAPCDGNYYANYPFPDGRIESGVIGPDYQALETYVTATGTPHYTLDTAALSEGLYTYFCRLHPTMRGALYVTE